MSTNKKITQDNIDVTANMWHKTIPFMRYKTVSYIISAIIILVSLFFIVSRGFNWGLDFTGGTIIEVSFSKVIETEEIRNSLENNGFQSALVQNTGGIQDVMIRLPTKEDGDSTVGTRVTDLIKSLDRQADIKSIEFVGPNMGEELTQSAVYAVLATLVMLLLYVGFRFEWRLGMGAMLALAHDVIVVLGVFAFLQVEMDLTFIAAILSVVGYSLNDSIVVFDRIRENFRKIRKVDTVEIVDISLTQTLARTLMTSVTTLIVILALLIWGGPSIYSFSLALSAGILFGAYSSIFIAVALALDLGIKREHMIPAQVTKEGADQASFEL